jgi:hypothetical protein
MGAIVFVAVLGMTFWFKNKKTSSLAEGEVREEGLTKPEKVFIWVACLLNPIISGAVLYYGWKKKLPVKAKQANVISWICVLISVVIAIIFVVVAGPMIQPTH